MKTLHSRRSQTVNNSTRSWVGHSNHTPWIALLATRAEVMILMEIPRINQYQIRWKVKWVSIQMMKAQTSPWLVHLCPLLLYNLLMITGSKLYALLLSLLSLSCIGKWLESAQAVCIIYALSSRIQVAFWETFIWLSWMGSLLISSFKVFTRRHNLSQRVSLETTNLQQKSHRLIIHQVLAQTRRWKKILISKPQADLMLIPSWNKVKLVSYLNKSLMLLKKAFGVKNQETPQHSK